MKPDYGIDAPPVIRNLLFFAFACFIAAYILEVRASSWAIALIWPGVFCALFAVFMILYAKFGKFRHRDRILAQVAWRGGERVLDVGTGRGLLLIGAAKHLSSGRAVGIDIWSQKDLSNNAAENTWRNAQAEGVKEKIDLLSEDVQHLSLADGSFDVIVSNLCLHNIPSREGREAACREIARVLKLGGTALISDFMHTKDYERVFQQMGLKTKRTGPYLFDTFPPLRIVTAQKNA